MSSLVDANGNTRTYTAVDQTHTKVTITNPVGSVAYSYTVGFDYSMNQQTITDGTNSNIISTSAYSDFNDPYKPSTVTDGNGKVTAFTWDHFGNLLTSTSPRGTQTTLTWDYSAFSLGRLMQVQEGTKTPTSFTYYEPSGLPQYVNTPTPGHSGDGATVGSSFTYDSLGNVLTVINPGNNAAATTTTTFNYTVDGSYTQPASIGEPVKVTDPLGHVTHLRNDVRGNAISVTDAVNNETDTTYNIADQPVSVVYPLTWENGSGHAYDQMGCLYPGGPELQLSTYGENGVLAAQVNFTLGFEGELLTKTGRGEAAALSYDAAYRVTGVTDGNNHTILYSFNTAGCPAAISYPGGGSVQFTSYDIVGNVLQKVDGRGLTSNYIYNDPENLLTDIQYSGSPGLNVHASYDAFGRTYSVSDGAGSYAYVLDDLDSLLSATTTYSGLPAKSIGYSYYPDGSRSAMSTPAGNFSYLYDAAGRPTSQTNPYSESASWTYLNNDWRSKQTLPSARITNYGYNARGQVKTQTISYNTSGLTYVTSAFTLSHNGTGDLTSLSVTGSGYTGATNYYYDPSTNSRLGQEVSTRAGGYTNNFAYDGAGNPTTFKSTTNFFNSNNQNSAYTWDGEGNPTTYKGTVFGYDVEDHVTSIGTTLTAGYRSDGLRAWKQTSAGRTYFLYDGTTPACELNNTGGVTAVNTFGAVGLISRRVGTTSTFYLFDPQGNVAARSVGTTASAFAFDGFGAWTGTAQPTDPWGYGARLGCFTDLETGLVLMGQRYYDPATGRFLNRDPIGQAGGINEYSYVQNSPLNFADPDGLILNYLLGAGSGVAIGYAISWLTGDCYTWGDAIRDASLGALGVGIVNKVGEGIAAIRAARAARAASMAMRQVRAAGIAGEVGANITKNTKHIVSLTNTASYRVPDELSEALKLIGEVKNVRSLSYTKQLKDFAAYAQKQGYTFKLTVRQGTALSKDLQAEVDAGRILLRRIGN